MYDKAVTNLQGRKSPNPPVDHTVQDVVTLKAFKRKQLTTFLLPHQDNK